MRDAAVQVHQVERLEGKVLRLGDPRLPVRGVVVDLVVDPFGVPRTGARLVEVLDGEELGVAVCSDCGVGGSAGGQGDGAEGGSAVVSGPLGPAERGGGEGQGGEEGKEGKEGREGVGMHTDTLVLETG